MRYVVIMAGGSGKRLWPLSRQDMPKQLLKVLGGKSLLRIAFERLVGTVPTENILICTGADYADVVAAELPEVGPDNILGEPEGRDSLNAVAWPAAVLALRDPEASVAVVTADQIMHPVSAFQAGVGDRVRGGGGGRERAGHLRGRTHRPAHRIRLPGARSRAGRARRRLRRSRVQGEAGRRDRRRSYVASGRYWWNSGMFVWRAQTLLDQLAHLMPETEAAVRRLAAEPELLAEIYPALVKISVDYALMEPVSQGQGTAHVVAVRLPITWHDVGGFASLGEQLPRDEYGNATQGTSVLVDARDNLVINHTEDGRVVAVVGLSDTVIVQTPQITLVCPISDAERIKELVAEVTSQLGRAYA